MATSPQAVARTIKAAGIMTSPRGREGVHVTRSGPGACVDIDIDLPSHRERLAVAVHQALLLAGYSAERRDIPRDGVLPGGVLFTVDR